MSSRFAAHVVHASATLFFVGVVVSCGTEPSASDETTVDAGVGAGADAASGDASRVDAVGSDAAGPVPDTGSVEDASSDVRPDPDAGVMDPPPDGPDPALVEACEGSCFERDQVGSDFGFCDVRDERTCTDFCVDAVADQPDDVQVALFVCLKTDPLCFQTPLQCVLDQLYPEPFEHTTTLVGEGYDAWIGAPVYAAMERSGRPGTFDVAEGEVDGAGRFEIGIGGVRSANSPHTMFYFVDSDTDGACDETREMVGSAGLDLYAWPFDEVRVPDWRVSVEPDASRRTAFACDVVEGALGR